MDMSSTQSACLTGIALPTPAPQVGDCPNRCDRLFRQMQGQQQVLASDEHMSEQAQEAEMLELFG